MTRVYFVRHAQPNYNNHNDSLRELTEKGMQDRKLVTDFLMDKGVDAAYSSPYKRAIDTIRDFTDRAGLPITLVEDFRERKVDSVWIEDFEAFSRRQWSDFSYRLSDGESLAQVETRNAAALERLVEANPGKTLIVGSHGTAMCVLMHHYDQTVGYENFVKFKNKMPCIVEFSFDEAGKCSTFTIIDLY